MAVPSGSSAVGNNIKLIITDTINLSSTIFSQDMMRLDPPLYPAQLPAHSALGSVQVDDTRLPNMTAFVSSALNTARTFTRETILVHGKQIASDGANSRSYTCPGYRYRGKDAQVKCLSWKATSGSGTWAARFTSHEGVAQPGDATWEEFENTIRQNHSLREKDYTPSVIDAYEVCQWDTSVGIADWTNVEMRLFESRHKMPIALLGDRVFTILVVTGEPAGQRKGARSFYVLTIPVVLAQSKYSAAKDIVHGSYAAVEFVHEVQRDEKTEIDWVMATASDAKGVLPRWVQASAVKKEIAKDVGLVMTWVDNQRTGSKDLL